MSSTVIQPIHTVNLAKAEPDSNKGNLYHREITDLRNHYLQKHKEVTSPWVDLLHAVSLVIAVAAAVLSSFQGFAAFLFGFAIYGILNAASKILLNCMVKQIHQEAADALLVPGFYEFARGNPKHFASADAVVAAYRKFIA